MLYNGPKVIVEELRVVHGLLLCPAIKKIGRQFVREAVKIPVIKVWTFSVVVLVAPFDDSR
jgi:hypothetical protein